MLETKDKFNKKVKETVTTKEKEKETMMKNHLKVIQEMNQQKTIEVNTMVKTHSSIVENLNLRLHDSTALNQQQDVQLNQLTDTLAIEQERRNSCTVCSSKSTFLILSQDKNENKNKNKNQLNEEQQQQQPPTRYTKGRSPTFSIESLESVSSSPNLSAPSAPSAPFTSFAPSTVPSSNDDSPSSFKKNLKNSKNSSHARRGIERPTDILLPPTQLPSKLKTKLFSSLCFLSLLLITL